MLSLFHIPFALLALSAKPATAGFPYNPTRVLVTNNGSAAYIFSSQTTTSQADFQLLNISDSIDTSRPSLSTLTTGLPFLSSSSAKAFTPILNAGDLNIVAGDCSDGLGETELWHFTTNETETTGRWDKLSLSRTDSTFNSNFLSAGFSFSPTASLNDASFYMFGGMCPNNNSTVEEWTSNAVYCNDMLSMSPNPTSLASYPNCAYESSAVPTRGPPVAEAGLTITPLIPTYSNTSSSSPSQQQNFVLIGGHTQQAFINMSQVAVFSLPQESWSFQAVHQPDPGKTALLTRSNALEVEPRSGHTAVLTPDGSKIVVFGGWVGDVSTPAEPQLVILELGQGYGGPGDWAWAVPSTPASPLISGHGIYGHGAAMLNGGVMLISGGYSISTSSSNSRRQNLQTANTQMFLFNVTSSSFVSTYTNPVSPASSSSVENKPGNGVLRSTSQKAGLGAGLVLGFSAVAGVIAVYIFYSRRLRQKRIVREKELRELALGAERYHSGDLVGGGADGRGGNYPEMRSASWGSRQEKRISSPSDDYPWAPVAAAGQGRNGEIETYGNGERDAERTGLLVEIPSPTRGLRRSLLTRGPVTYSPSISGPNNLPYGTTATPGDIHTITEQDEESEASGSLKRPKSSKSRRGGIRPESGSSDPFKDPPLQLSRSQSEVDRRKREREVKGWVEDWETVGAAMESGRTYQPSSSRPDQSQVNSNNSRSGSPEKSDRTNSNLSERSTMSSSSIQRSVFGSISRNVSMRSASAGYMLFASAAAAMTGRATLVNHPGPGISETNSSPARAPSKRSASLNFNSNASTRYKGGDQRDRSDTFTTAHTSFGPTQPGESDALLSRGGSSRQGNGYDEVFETPPESPVRERQPAGSTAGKKALGWMGSMRRALTGTAAGEGVRRRVEEYEQRHANSTPISKDQPQMTETGYNGSPRRAASASAAFWRGKKGAKDWDAEPLSPSTLTAGPSSTTGGTGTGTVVRRKPLPDGQAEATPTEGERVDDEWDVEAAVQKRLVQVMFTVPKEKLRVVNVDQLSLLSGDGEGDGGGGKVAEEQAEPGKRVSTVVEEGESPIRDLNGNGMWKGKGKEVDKG
jgi:hypothetical protein